MVSGAIPSQCAPLQRPEACGLATFPAPLPVAQSLADCGVAGSVRVAEHKPFLARTRIALTPARPVR